MGHEKRIAVWGLLPEEIDSVAGCLPARGIDIVEVACATDLIAMDWLAILVNADAMGKDDRELLYWFYQEAGEAADALLFYGKDDVPAGLKRFIRTYRSFRDMDKNLKYVLLTAYRKKKNSENYSRILARAIRVLGRIRSRPGITTAALAEELEESPRAIQRSIETLRAAGEFIDYDASCRGWKLSFGKSVLLDEM